MAWEDKTLEGIYTAPSGKEIPFLWEKSSRETKLKTGVFTFPDRDGAHVQHQGAGAKSFPLTCIFSGPDCMDQADEFEAALFERDVAELRHPVYGIVKVIPTGDIKREDDLISALNESRVTVTFTETITEDAAPMDTVTADAIDETLEEFSESAAADFAAGVSAETVAEKLQLQSVMAAQVKIIDNNIIPLAEGDPAVLAEARTVLGELKGGINSMVSQAAVITNTAQTAENYVVKCLNAARQTLNVMKLPSRTKINVMEKIKGYSLITANLINQFRNDPFGTKNAANAYQSARLVLSGCLAALVSGTAVTMASTAAGAGAAEINRIAVMSPPPGESSGSGESALNLGARTIAREDARNIINNIFAMFEKIKSFQDSKIADNTFIDSDSSANLLLNKLVYSGVSLIMSVSLSLPMRRTITLDRDRQLVELVCELYGSEDCIDRFIADNDLSIDELEVLPMGREVSYYAQIA